MKITELMKELEAYKSIHGDIDVLIDDGSGEYCDFKIYGKDVSPFSEVAHFAIILDIEV